MNDGLFNNMQRRLDGDSPDDVLFHALEQGYEEVIVIGKSGDEIEISYDYQDDLMALGMIRVAENEILKTTDN